MRNIIAIIILFTAISVNGAEVVKEGMHQGPLKLMDGSFLFVNQDSTMRMVDSEGRPIKMKDGVEMTLMDGSRIMMKDKKIWRHVHRKMK